MPTDTRDPDLAALRFARHALTTRFEDLPPPAIRAAKVFLLDTLGVGISGSTDQSTEPLLQAAASWGTGPEAVVWGRPERLPAPAAALVNGFQAHCQEYDCVHEAAVLHPMATLLPAALAWAEREGGVTGRAFLTALVVGVDIAIGLGLAARAGLRFFRPATAGGFGATAAVARLAGLDEAGLTGAFVLQYAQSSGTMQPHIEGSVALPLQIGFNSRAALTACDLTRAGIAGPRDVFEGPFGYLPLFEGTWDLAPVWLALGRTWRIAELSHKPYPSGRATHAGIEGVAALCATHGFKAAEIARITVLGPPLIHRLCGRPAIPHPSPGYARLCMGFAIAKLLQHGALDPVHYRGEALSDPETFALARRVTTLVDGNPDPNALVPQSVSVELNDGTALEWRCDQMLANPARPLSPEQHLAKFRSCWSLAAAPLGPPESLIDMVEHLEELDDMRTLAVLLVP
jgi:aconitate decarboxylase